MRKWRRGRGAGTVKQSEFEQIGTLSGRKLKPQFSKRRGLGEVGVLNGKFLEVKRKARVGKVGKGKSSFGV